MIPRAEHEPNRAPQRQRGVANKVTSAVKRVAQAIQTAPEMLGMHSPENNEPLHEAAKEVRQTAFDLFSFGTTGSKDLIPTEQTRGTTSVSALLQYSLKAHRHLQALLGVLSAPREFQITARPEQGWGGDEPDGDVIYEADFSWNPTHTYMFPNKTTAPYLNAFAAALYNWAKNNSSLDVSIRRVSTFASWKNVWIMEYSYRPGARYNPTVIDSNFPEEVYRLDQRGLANGKWYNPGSNWLFQFYFLPKPITNKKDAKSFCAGTLAPITVPHVHPTDIEQQGAFQVCRFHFDIDGLRQAGTKEKLRPGDLYRGFDVGEYAFEKGLVPDELTLVCLGKANIDGQTFYIYSGSELPLAREKAKEPTASAAWQTQAEMATVPVEVR